MTTELIPTIDRSKLIEAVKESYRSEVRRFLDYTEANGLTMESYQVYIDGIETEGKSVSTINKHIAAIRALIRRMIESPDLTDVQRWRMEKAIGEVPFRKKAKNAKAITGEKYLTPDEIERLILRSPKRTAVIVRFLQVTGLRIAEALSITSGDCKATSERVEIRVLGKGKKERKVWITSTLYEEITGTFHGAKHLFESKSLVPLHDRNVAKELGRLGAKHLGRHVTPHMLRHSFATHMIAKTGKRKAVSEYLGHSSTAITEDMYNHETLTDSDLGLGADLLKSAIGLRSDGCCLRS